MPFFRRFSAIESLKNEPLFAEHLFAVIVIGKQ